MSEFTFIDLFAGIGGIRLGFEAVGGTCVFASENDPEAQAIYQHNFQHEPAGDIHLIDAEAIPDHTILTAGFPCQPFSIIGNKLGFADTRGTLFFEIERILVVKRPPAFLLENVRQLASHDQHRTLKVILQRLESLGYSVTWGILNALDFGLPQKRERTFIIGFHDPNHYRLPVANKTQAKTLLDVLEDDTTIASQWFASDYIVQKRLASVQHKQQFFPSIWHENKGGNISILPFSCALRAHASFNYLLVNGRRRLTPREQLRLQGFPEWFEIYGSESSVRRLIGNSVAVPVVEAVAQSIVNTLFHKHEQPIQLQLGVLIHE